MQTALTPFEDHVLYTVNLSGRFRQSEPSIALWWIDDWAKDPDWCLDAIARTRVSQADDHDPIPWLIVALTEPRSGLWTFHVPDGRSLPRPSIPPVAWDPQTGLFPFPDEAVLRYATRYTKMRLTLPASPPSALLRQTQGRFLLERWGSILAGIAVFETSVFFLVHLVFQLSWPAWLVYPVGVLVAWVLSSVILDMDLPE